MSINTKDKVKMAEQHGIKFKRDVNNDLFIERIPLSDIYENSFNVSPKINCRNIYPRRLNQIKETINTKGHGIDIIWGIKNEQTGKYGIVDGNHLQTVAREIGEEFIRLFIFEGDASDESVAWPVFCFSYAINENSMSIVEKIEAVHYGFLYHKKRNEKYLELLPEELGEPIQTVGRYKRLYVRALKLSKEHFEELVENSKAEDYSEKEFARNLLRFEQKEEEERKDVMAQDYDAETKNYGDELIFNIMNYINKIDRNVRELSESDVIIEDINKELEKTQKKTEILLDTDEIPSKKNIDKLTVACRVLSLKNKTYKKKASALHNSWKKSENVVRKLDKIILSLSNK